MNMACGILNNVEVASRFYLSNAISPSERLATSTLDKTNWWADLFGGNMGKVSGVYEIVNKVNGHRYIGSSVDIYKRWKNHRRDLSNDCHHSVYLQRAYNKYGTDNFMYSVLLLCSCDMCLIYEQLCLDGMSKEYNICTMAGSTLGITISDRARERMRQSHLGVPLSESHRNNARLALIGRAVSSDTRHKLHMANKGTKPWITGKKMPEYAKHKISQTLMGHSVSEETRRKISDAGKGRIVSDETRQRMRDGHRRRRTEEI